MKKGTVKWFNDKKGFGFLSCPELKGDVFVHYSAIEGGGHRTLAEDDKVEFSLDPAYTDKLRAKSVRKI